MVINKKTLILITTVVLVVAFGIWYWAEKNVETGEIKKIGILAGHATVGPICPVERVGQPCPVPKEAYTSRSLIVYQSDGKTIAAQKNFDEQGNYEIELPVGNYIVDIPHQGGLGSAKDLPKQVSIKEGQITKLDIDIDTGIR